MIIIFLASTSLIKVDITSAQTLEQFQVLLYTSPDRWHDLTVPVAVSQFEQLAKKHTFGLIWAQASGSKGTKNVFSDEFLNKIDVIVFLQTKGSDLSDQQMDSFKRFIRNGAGFVGIHATSTTKNKEQWFQKLIGRVMTLHPEEQTAVLHVENKNHPATMHLPDHWIWTDEWYSFEEALTDNQQVLLTLDEGTYDPNRTWGDDRATAMGDFHPISWYHEYDGGRSFYTTLGHLPESYKDPVFMAHKYGGIIGPQPVWV
ncbi:MAG: ThuA domain-containing protein [Cyclobacteriaceae bacterium]